MSKAEPQRKLSLVEQALLGREKVAGHGVYMPEESKDEADLFVAWCDGRLETSDVLRVLHLGTSEQIHRLAGAVIRNAVKSGYLRIARTDTQPKGEQP